MKFIPGLLGSVCIVVGLAMVAIPLGLIAAGAFLLLLDRRVS